MDASASPLKPKLAMASRSDKSLILLVACRLRAKANSSLAMPLPLSVIFIFLTPSIAFLLFCQRNLFFANDAYSHFSWN